MERTLVEELRIIEKITPDVNKIAEYREALDKWAKSNSVVRRTINGDINLSDEWEVIYKRLYGPLGAKGLIPNYINKEKGIVDERGQEMKINELEEVIGIAFDNLSNVAVNPTFGAVGGVGLGYFCGKIIDRLSSEKIMDRRGFLWLAGSFALGGIIGTSAGRYVYDTRILKVKYNADYVQSIISLVYNV